MSPRWDWFCDPDPFSTDLPEADQAEAGRRWQALTEQRDKLSARLSWLAENEDSPEFAEREALTSRSREKFEAQLVELAAWAGCAPADLAGLLLETEAGSIQEFCTSVGYAAGKASK